MKDGKMVLITYHLLESSICAYIEWLVNELMMTANKTKIKMHWRSINFHLVSSRSINFETTFLVHELLKWFTAGPRMHACALASATVHERLQYSSMHPIDLQLVITLPCKLFAVCYKGEAIYLHNAVEA